MHTDASIDGLAAVLLQRFPDDNSLHPIYYIESFESEHDGIDTISVCQTSENSNGQPWTLVKAKNKCSAEDTNNIEQEEIVEENSEKTDDESSLAHPKDEQNNQEQENTVPDLICTLFPPVLIVGIQEDSTTFDAANFNVVALINSLTTDVRHLLERETENLRDIWYKRMSYSINIPCPCSKSCKLHEVKQCTDHQCMHLLPLNECLTNKVVECDYRLVKTDFIQKYFFSTSIEGPELPSPPVFISYQWESQETVLHLRRRIELAGFPCWMDVGNLQGGEALYGKIYEGINKAKEMIESDVVPLPYDTASETASVPDPSPVVWENPRRNRVVRCSVCTIL
ncbi:death domain-containing protein [Trichonephila clavipes]|nr:death domain-containing protein [Trichonephila clavipes]